MSKTRACLKAGITAAVLFFNKAAFADDDDLTGQAWVCDDIGVFQFEACPDDNDKTCAYALSVTEKAAQDFQLNVDDITNMPPTLIVKDLKRKGSRYVRGDIMNSRIGVLKLASVSIRPVKSEDEEIRVTGRLGIFSRQYRCSR